MWESPLSLFSWWGITKTEQIWNRSRKQEKLFVVINAPPTMRVDILRNNTLKMKENTFSRKYFLFFKIFFIIIIFFTLQYWFCHLLFKQEHLFKCGKILLNPIVCRFKNTSFISLWLDAIVKRRKICFVSAIMTLFLLHMCMLKCAFLHLTLSLYKKDIVLISSVWNSSHIYCHSSYSIFPCSGEDFKIQNFKINHNF